MGAGHCYPYASRERAGHESGGFSIRRWTGLNAGRPGYCGNVKIVSKMRIVSGAMCLGVLVVRAGQEEAW